MVNVKERFGKSQNALSGKNILIEKGIIRQKIFQTTTKTKMKKSKFLK
jgi:hypothetical protein